MRWYHYPLQVLVFIIGNLYRLVFQTIFNLGRLVYDRLRIGSAWKALTVSMKGTVRWDYIFDGILKGSSSFLSMWPTYTKRPAGSWVDHGYAKGNCMDYAFWARWVREGSGRVRIYIPGFDLKKIHYLYENEEGTWDLVRRGERFHRDMTAKQVMARMNIGKHVYTVW